MGFAASLLVKCVLEETRLEAFRIFDQMMEDRGLSFIIELIDILVKEDEDEPNRILAVKEIARQFQSPCSSIDVVKKKQWFAGDQQLKANIKSALMHALSGVSSIEYGKHLNKVITLILELDCTENPEERGTWMNSMNSILIMNADKNVFTMTCIYGIVEKVVRRDTLVATIIQSYKDATTSMQFRTENERDEMHRAGVKCFNKLLNGGVESFGLSVQIDICQFLIKENLMITQNKDICSEMLYFIVDMLRLCPKEQVAFVVTSLITEGLSTQLDFIESLKHNSFNHLLKQLRML